MDKIRKKAILLTLLEVLTLSSGCSKNKIEENNVLVEEKIVKKIEVTKIFEPRTHLICYCISTTDINPSVNNYIKCFDMPDGYELLTITTGSYGILGSQCILYYLINTYEVEAVGLLNTDSGEVTFNNPGTVIDSKKLIK